MTRQESENSNLRCYVYKGKRRADSYLYVTEEGDFSKVPPTLLTMLGSLELVMSLDLSPVRKLAHANVAEVIEQLRQLGFYLQMNRRPFDPLM
jgi:hypothetical protein